MCLLPLFLPAGCSHSEQNFKSYDHKGQGAAAGLQVTEVIGHLGSNSNPMNSSLNHLCKVACKQAPQVREVDYFIGLILQSEEQHWLVRLTACPQVLRACCNLPITARKEHRRSSLASDREIFWFVATADCLLTEHLCLQQSWVFFNALEFRL